MTTTLTATYDGRALIPTGAVDLPKGATLQLRVEIPDQFSAPLQAESLSQGLLAFSGIMEGLPTDLSENHDHYLHGTPKRP